MHALHYLCNMNVNVLGVLHFCWLGNSFFLLFYIIFKHHIEVLGCGLNTFMFVISGLALKKFFSWGWYHFCRIAAFAH